MGWDKTPADRQRDSQRYGAAWRKARLACLRAASWRCQIQIPGVCIHSATQVDHVDGAENDPQHRNLRAACSPCHKQVTAKQGNEAKRARRSDPPAQPRTDWGIRGVR